MEAAFTYPSGNSSASAKTSPCAGAWSGRVEGYIYSLRFDEDPVTECFAWHWHPTSRSDTHLHVNAAHSIGGDLSRLHVPTGWTALQDVLRFAIIELGVLPLRADWSSILRSRRQP